MERESSRTLAALTNSSTDLDSRLRQGLDNSHKSSTFLGSSGTKDVAGASRTVSIAPRDAPLSEREDVLRSLPPLTNLYFVSRKRAAAHHVRVIYYDGLDRHSVHFIGENVASLKRASMLECGPCCKTIDFGDADSSLRPTDECNEYTSAAISIIVSSVPGASGVVGKYLGYYGEITVSEIICRTIPRENSVRDELHAQLRTELDVINSSRSRDDTGLAPADELDALDLKCMLSILETSRFAEKIAKDNAMPSTLVEPKAGRRVGKVGGASSSAIPSYSDAVIHAAHVNIRVDSAGQIISLTGEPLSIDDLEFFSKVKKSLQHTLDYNVASLRQLRLRSTSAWLGFSLKTQGSLLLLEALQYPESGTMSRKEMESNIRRLFDSAIHHSDKVMRNALDLTRIDMPLEYCEKRQLCVQVLRRGEKSGEPFCCGTILFDMGECYEAHKIGEVYRLSVPLPLGLVANIEITTDSTDISEFSCAWKLIVVTEKSFEGPPNVVRRSNTPFRVHDGKYAYCLAPTIVPPSLRVNATVTDDGCLRDVSVVVKQAEGPF